MGEEPGLGCCSIKFAWLFKTHYLLLSSLPKSLRSHSQQHRLFQIIQHPSSENSEQNYITSQTKIHQKHWIQHTLFGDPEGHRRIPYLWSQIMPLADGHRDSLAGLTLDDVLANRAAAASSNQLTTTNNCRTLLDIIREDESSKKDRKSWKTFKDKLRLKRAGSAWTSSVLIPASDIPFQLKNYRSLPTQLPRRSSVRVLTFSPVDVTTHRMADPTEEAIKSSNLAATMMTRQRSSRHQIGDAFFVEEKLKPQMSRPSSTRLASLRSDSIRRERLVSFRDSNFDSDDDDEDGDGHTTRGPSEVRQMSAREAVAAQEAAEAAAMAAEAEEEEDAGPFWNKGGGPVTMSLMDLLEETDRQMGLEGSAYRMDDDDDDYDDDDFDEDEDEYEDGEEHNCCVCMVKNICAPFEPCGHSFCRMCSRDLTVSKGNCPLCNNFILEILEVF